jgi:hypothetical protein
MNHNCKQELYQSIKYFSVILIFFCVFLIICSPLKEIVIDDDFATLWEVKNYLATNHYIPSSWTAPYTYPQVLYGVYIAKLFSPFIPIEIILRLSTIFFSFLSLLVIFLIFKSIGFNNKVSTVCCLQLLACPIFTYLSYLFYSDIPFLGISLLSIYLYQIGISQKNLSFSLLASILASSAILLRQTGIVLPLALFFYFLFGKLPKKFKIFNFLTLILPILATLHITINQGAVHTFAGILHNIAQREYISIHNLPQFLLNSLQRTIFFTPTTLVFMTFPLSFIILFNPLNKMLKKQSIKITKSFLISNLRTNVVLLGIVFVFFTILFVSNKTWRMPYLPWYSYFNVFFISSKSIAIFSLITLLTCVYLIFLFLKSYSISKSKSNNFILDIIRLHPLLSWFTALSFGLLLAIFKIGDKYFLILVPFFLVFLGYLLYETINKNFRQIVLIIGLIIIGNAVILDSAYNTHYYEYLALQKLGQQGISKDNISYQLMCYDRFEKYVQEVGNNPPNIEKGMYYDFFFRWCPEQHKNSMYKVVTTSDSNIDITTKFTKIIDVSTYKNKIGRSNKVMILKDIRP